MSLSFLLGTHSAAHLAQSPVPMFISYHRVWRRDRQLARCLWGQDSRGYMQLTMRGGYALSAREYAKLTCEHAAEIGGLSTVSIQDWLRHREPRPLPCMYVRHADAYAAVGVDLTARPLVGVGSICRRQSGPAGAAVIRRIAQAMPQVRLHAFGFKFTGLRAVAPLLASADSLAWSYDARRRPPLPGHSHRNCANCLDYALRWRERMLGDAAIARARGEVIADLEGMAGFEALVREWRALRPARPTQTALFKEVLNA